MSAISKINGPPTCLLTSIKTIYLDSYCCALTFCDVFLITESDGSCRKNIEDLV